MSNLAGDGRLKAARRALDVDVRWPDLPVLPLTVVAASEQCVSLSGPVWTLADAYHAGDELRLNWPAEPTATALSERAWHIARLYIAHRVQRQSPSTCQNDLSSLLRFDRWLMELRRFGDREDVLGRSERRFGWEQLSEGLTRAFLEHGRTTGNQGIDTSRLRTFYRWGVRRRLPDFDVQTLQLLEEIRAPGNEKGRAVIERDPLTGPLTESETEDLSAALRDERGTAQDRAVVMLHLELGPNPLSVARLLNRDLVRYETAAGVFTHLHLPLVKKRGGSVRRASTRRPTRPRAISTTLAALLRDLAQGGPDDPLLWWLHARRNPKGQARQAMRRFARVAELRSREGKALWLTGRRFRRTLATTMGEQGASGRHIAFVLGHADTQNVGVYTEQRASVADHVETATDRVLAPLFGRFRGIIVEHRADTSDTAVVWGTVPHLANLSLGGIGACGRDIRVEGVCTLWAPLACYTCPKFAAWSDAPHAELLSAIEALAPAGPLPSDARIPAQLKPTAAAIRDVLVQIARAPATGATQ